MNEETKKLLLDCKKAGYKYVAIGVRDERVPSSSEKVTGNNGYWHCGKNHQNKVICCEPEIRPNGKPAIWSILEQSPLTAGVLYKGQGCGETHNVRGDHKLELGCYDLSKVE